jgi:hypothetical protein
VLELVLTSSVLANVYNAGKLPPCVTIIVAAYDLVFQLISPLKHTISFSLRVTFQKIQSQTATATMSAYLDSFRQCFFIPSPVLTEKNLPNQSGRVFIVTGGYAGRSDNSLDRYQLVVLTK